MPFFVLLFCRILKEGLNLLLEGMRHVRRTYEYICQEKKSPQKCHVYFCQTLIQGCIKLLSSLLGEEYQKGKGEGNIMEEYKVEKGKGEAISSSL